MAIIIPFVGTEPGKYFPRSLCCLARWVPYLRKRRGGHITNINIYIFFKIKTGLGCPEARTMDSPLFEFYAPSKKEKKLGNFPTRKIGNHFVIADQNRESNVLHTYG